MTKKNQATMEAIKEVGFKETVTAVVDAAEMVVVEIIDKVVEATKDTDSIKVITCGESVQLLSIVQ